MGLDDGVPFVECANCGAHFLPREVESHLCLPSVKAMLEDQAQRIQELEKILEERRVMPIADKAALISKDWADAEAALERIVGPLRGAYANRDEFNARISGISEGEWGVVIAMSLAAICDYLDTRPSQADSAETQEPCTHDYVSPWPDGSIRCAGQFGCEAIVFSPTGTVSMTSP